MMTRSNLCSENIILVAERRAGWRGGKGVGQRDLANCGRAGKK